MMFLGRLMRSAMVLISLKAFSMARSELLMVLRFWYFEFPNSSKLAAPVPCGGGEQVQISQRRHRGCVVTTGILDTFFPAVQKSEQICVPKTNKHAVATATVVTATSHLAYHGGEVASVEQRVLSISHSGGVFEGFLVGKRPPLRAHVDDAITYERR